MGNSLPPSDFLARHARYARYAMAVGQRVRIMENSPRDGRVLNDRLARPKPLWPRGGGTYLGGSFWTCQSAAICRRIFSAPSIFPGFTRYDVTPRW